jgi:hypothetical protein
MTNSNALSLPVPPLAEMNPQSIEVLRVWAAPGSPQQLTLQTTWKDSSAWGLLLVDIARHVANAYQAQGYDREQVLARIRDVWNVEWNHPTDNAKEL